jgi:CheY-like chemotaxis protein
MAPSADRSPLAGIRVLVVDDNLDAREILEALLAAEGASVATFSSSAGALQYLDYVLPDVMLVDIGMPVVNGFELIQRLRQRPADQGGLVPAAALTGYISGEDRDRALATGFQAYLLKPVDPPVLVETVRSLAADARRKP